MKRGLAIVVCLALVALGISVAFARGQESGLIVTIFEDNDANGWVQSHTDALSLFAFPDRVFAWIHIPEAALWISLEKRENIFAIPGANKLYY